MPVPVIAPDPALAPAPEPVLTDDDVVVENYEDPLTPEDFEAKVADTIDEGNLESELANLERELGL